MPDEEIENLKPDPTCPLCGSTSSPHTIGGKHWWECDSSICNCLGPQKDTEAEALTAWTNRALCRGCGHRPSSIAEDGCSLNPVVGTVE
jgi:hypothetical protein